VGVSSFPSLPGPVQHLVDGLRHAGSSGAATWTVTAAKHALRFLSQHTGLPALVVAAVLVVVGFRLLKKSARFAAEVAVVAILLVALTELGWIQW
jgi:hypothetical protein